MASAIFVMPWAAAFLSLAIGAVVDVRHRIIPDSCCVTIALSGVFLQVSSPSGGFVSSIAVCLTLLVSLGILAHYGFLGGGDVKLIAACSLLAAPADVLTLLIEIVLAGGVLGCIYLTTRSVLRFRVAHPTRGSLPVGKRNPVMVVFDVERARILSGEPMPYGVAIASGVLYHLAKEPPL